MKKLAILEVTSVPCWGGREQHVKELSKGLRERGHKVIITARDIPIFRKMFSEVADFSPLPLRSALDIESIRKMAKLIREENIDIVHTHSGRDSWIGVLATMAAGKGKVVRTRHGVFKSKNDIIHRWHNNSLAGIICVSQMVKKEFMRGNLLAHPERVTVIYNGIDIKRIENGSRNVIRDELGIGENDFLIGYVGRISEEKGIEYLVRAAAVLKERGMKFHVILVGEGSADYTAMLKRETAEAGLDNIVHFYGFMDNIGNVIQAINVLVLPSVCEEACPLVVSEGMAGGKPVITTNVGGQAELVEEGKTGLLVPPQSPGKLADTLERTINDQQLAESIGRNAQKTAFERYSLDRMVRDTEKCFFEWF